MKNLKRRLMMMETIFGNSEITEESRFTNTREKCLLMFDNITKKMEKGCQEKKGSHFREMYGKIWGEKIGFGETIVLSGEQLIALGRTQAVP